jgi:hypothetical protein
MKESTMQTARKFIVTSMVGLIGACAAQSETTSEEATNDEVPSADEDSLDPAQALVNGAYTATAHKPNSVVVNSIRASGTFTGPGPRRMGVCLLRLTTTACNTVADCNSAPATLPSGGFRYCTNPDATGTKYCAFRGGTQTQHCAGTPALGGALVNPGTFYTPNNGIPIDSTKYVSYACFEGCAASDPSISSATYSQAQCKVPACGNADYCVDNGCNGSVDWCVKGGQKVISTC